MRIHHTVTGLLLTSLLVACGGGGGGGGGSAPVTTGPVISTLSFPFQSANSALIANGYTKTYTISGDCTGTATDTAMPAAAVTGGATFGSGSTVGQQSVQQTLSINFTSCTASSSVSTAISYFDSNYTPQGSVASAISRVYLTPPVIPASVVVGSGGRIGTLTNYDRSPTPAVIGTTDVSYLVVPETATTAILNLTSVNADNAGTVISTEQDRYRIGITGALTPISIDILQNVTAGPKHLVFQ